MVSREADVFIIGAGECGSNLVGSYIQKSKKQTGASRIREYLIINTDKTDLMKTRTEYSIPNQNTLMYSDEEIGVGGKFKEGYDLVIKNQDLILNQLKGLGYEGVSGFIILTSLGGGTGCGGTPALVELLHKQFSEERRIFIYVFGVLPFENQSSEAINSIWSLSTLLRNQLEPNKGPNLIFLLSNKTMLKRVMAWREGRASALLDQSLGIDSADLASSDEQQRMETEVEFTQLVNPLALQTIEAILSPSIQEPGKKVMPTTDLADYSRRLDPVVVPCYFEDMYFLPKYGSMEKQMALAARYAVNHCSLTDIETKPMAGSVYSIFSGHKDIAKLEYSAHLKKILAPYLVKGGSIQPSFVTYDDPNIDRSSILLLFGLPLIPELRDVFNDATNLIAYHDDSKSTIKRGWFERSKGVNREQLQIAMDDILNLFGKYMTTTEDHK
ncbi:MAG: hypothetical protein JSW11_13745 [Candidatus Heimdallarchaeota archaeon]|nr:MAG: hypothetical protein JSW11_13745 [Candidatus Heimdallarchaeota archaeon]